MRAFNKKIVFIYMFVITYIIAKLMIAMGTIPMINNYLNVFLWFAAFLICVILTRRDYNRYLETTDKTQVTFIIVLLYLMIYFLFGLVTGYQRNAYSLTPKGILMNTFFFMTPIVCEEYIRQALITYSGGKSKIMFFITMLFVLLGINFGSFLLEFSNAESGFKYICSDLLPLIVSNMIFTYLTYVSGFKPAMVYRLMIQAFWMYLPILPDINWFYTGLCGVLVPVIIYIFINYSHSRRVGRLTRKEEKQQKPSSYIPMAIVTAIVMGFVLGFFKYQPVAVVTDSMYPFFARGDVVVIKKLTKEEMIKEIQINDVIKFQGDGFYIVHRVIDIVENEDGTVEYVTKGDYNNVEDGENVTMDKVEGVYLMHIKYIGFPSVWLSEAFR